MSRKNSSLFLFLFFALTISMFLPGCSDNSGNSADHKTTTSGAKPFSDPQLKMVGEEEPQSLTSWLIKEVTDGLSEGITCFIGDKTTGRVLNGISGHTDDSGASGQFQQMTAQLDSIQSQVGSISYQIASLSAQIGLNQAQLDTQIGALPLNTSANIITSLFNTNAAASVYGYTPPAGNPDAAYGDSDGYMYFANKARNLSPVAKGAAGFAAYSTSLSSLKAQAQIFYTTNSIPNITTNLNSIYNVVCPSPGTPPILESYASLIIQSLKTATTDPNGIPYTDAQKAMNGYKLLEQFFAQIVSYQIQGNIIRTELRNYTGDATNAQTDLTNFQGYLSDEVNRFEAAVNFLMINMVDYRTPANYASDSAAMHTRGLVQDDVYNMVYARSRFVCAQLLSGNVVANTTPLTTRPPAAAPAINGLHGSIVVPQLYAYQGTSSTSITPGPITLKFTSYSSSSNYSSTITVQQPEPIPGQFPYTAWNYSNTTYTPQSYPDNNWLLYDFSAATDFPAGKYRITLVDGGNSGSPWYHSETDFGKVSVLYYDPQNPGTAGTLAPTGTNTFKFGSFSGRWNWGYNKISMSQWTTPSFVGSNDKNNPYTTTNAGKHFTSYGSPGAPFGLSVGSFKSTKEDEAEFTQFYEFSVVADTTPSKQPSLYMNITGTAVSSNFKVDYNYSLNEIQPNGSSKTTVLDPFSDSSFGANVSHTDTTQKSQENVLTAGKTYSLDAYAELNSNYIFGGGNRSGAISLISSFQVVYDGTLPLVTPTF